MATVNNDITRLVISEKDVRNNIASIFPDTVILDGRFKIVSISNNISECIGYSSKELIGLSISLLGNSNRFQQQLEEKLILGFFDECTFEIRDKESKSILFGISGFYLGLIADISDYIILKFKNIDEVHFLKSKLEAKAVELDQFVYYSAHNLRGPLATLKGLVNLLKENLNEPGYLVSQIEIFANRLDDKLFQLIHFAESDKIDTLSDVGSLTLIGEQLSNYITITTSNNNARYKQSIPPMLSDVENSTLIFNVLQNITSFFCQQPRSVESEIHFKASANNSLFELELIFKGVELSVGMIEKIKTVNFGYVEILRETEFTNLYVAKKIISKLKGSLYFTINHDAEILVYIIFQK